MKVTGKDRDEAIAKVTEALTEALDAAVNGAPGTGAKLTSAIVITAYDDGNITTRIAGYINKNNMFGALTEATLSIHELDRMLINVERNERDLAMVEKYTTGIRSDN